MLNRCQEDFERGWIAKKVATAAAATKAMEDQAVKAANKKGDEKEVVLYLDEDYAVNEGGLHGSHSWLLLSRCPSVFVVCTLSESDFILYTILNY